ncbi:uncharacterized protein LOC131876445 [Cryptomeria japonica]|uniref:uncharacterized protein LOC131876445 n=1 Tax=Cryptomeria japonica TaxID=3369 RepID=UPI0027DA219A|nr:uncharacterized protein LOC131876445 [Cryptomeria japonica]
MFSAMYFEGLDAECKEFSLERAKELPDGIMQLKGNKIPKGLVSLEHLFDHNDAYKNNKGVKFRRAMELSFGHLKDKIIVVYLDDLTVFSKRRKHHLRDLRQVLQRCRKNGVSLNLKKLVFGVIEETTRYIMNLMSEKQVFKWSEEGKKAFTSIKNAIGQAPVLVNPDFSIDFVIYCYASEHTMSGILLRKNEDNDEVPISFMHVPLKKHELKYSIMEKQAYAVVKEFNLEIRPTKLVRGHGLCKLIAESKEEVTEELPLVLFVGLQDSWFVDVAYYLTYGDCPEHLSMKEKRNLRLKAANNCLKDLEELLLLARNVQGRLCMGGQTTSEIICNFLKENILVRFGVPLKIVADNATNFSSTEISLFCYDHGISLAHSSDYYPKGNDKAESSNKNLINIMKKLVSENFKDWHKKLYEALWADCTSPKRAIGMSPFELVYGVGAQVALPLELAATKLKMVIKDVYFQSSLEKRIMHLTKIDEERDKLVDRIIEHQMRVKRIFDKQARPRKFIQGDQVLLWDRRREPKGSHAKFESLWKGPFLIHEVKGPNSFKLAHLDGTVLHLTYNGQDLKLYQL